MLRTTGMRSGLAVSNALGPTSTPMSSNHGEYPRTHVNLNVVTSLFAAKLNSFVGRVSAIVSSAHEFLLNAQSGTSEDTDQAS